VTAAVVLARPLRPALRELLGAAAADRLQHALRERAAAWARAAAGERALTVEAGESIAGQLAAASAQAYERWGGPILIAGIEAPRLGAAQTAGALADMAAGADASFGPGMDGGWYLAALARPLPEVFEPQAWEGDQPMAHALGLAQRLGIEVGVLRMERLLLGRRDALALGVDPLTPPEVRAALRQALA
jgi:hypothetical protein